MLTVPIKKTNTPFLRIYGDHIRTVGIRSDDIGEIHEQSCKAGIGNSIGYIKLKLFVASSKSLQVLNSFVWHPFQCGFF